MVRETGSEAKMKSLGISQEVTKHLALLGTPLPCHPNYITVAQQTAPKATCETLVLVATPAAELIKIVPYENEAKNHACITDRGIIDAYAGRSLYITITNACSTNVQLPNHQSGGEVGNRPEQIVQINDEQFLNHSGTHANNDSFVNEDRCKPMSNRLDETANHEAITLREKEVLKKYCQEDVQLPTKLEHLRPAFLDMRTEFQSMLERQLGRINV